MKTIKAYLKRFGALVIAYANKYRFDPFFRTECNIIALQVLFSFFLIAIVAVSFSYLYRDILSTLVDSIQSSIRNGVQPGTSGVLSQELDYIRTRNLWTIIASALVATVFFSYFIARITLAPTRNALSSQKRFIGNVAHELRTPLSIIKTNTEVALMNNHIEPTLKQTLKSSVEELDRISDIINNLLSLSASLRPERLEFANVDLGVIIDGALQKLGALVERRQQEISVRKGESVHVWGSASALEQVVMNILKNAISYTPRGGRISVTAELVQANHVELTIQDSGVGIGQKDLFHIFEPFYRAEPSRNRKQGGSGLGLTIVSELVKLHHGRILVRSAPKRGTTVTVILPCGKNMTKIDKFGAEKNGVSEINVDFSNKKF